MPRKPKEAVIFQISPEKYTPRKILFKMHPSGNSPRAAPLSS
jgi:hypothetical protein